VIPDDISAMVPPSADLKMVVKGAAKLKSLAPDAVSVADPLAFTEAAARTKNESERAILHRRAAACRARQGS
jgi:RND superfamily putative drug exporter